MRAELKAKAVVALVISLIAFGCGTGTSILTGLVSNDNNYSSYNLNTSTELPIIYNIKNTSTNTSSPSTVQTSPSNNQEVYEEDTNTNNQNNEPPTNNSNSNNTG
jgi:hypothetical protein